MNALRRRLLSLSWIAFVAALALTLLPGLSHALAFLQGDPTPWRAICTAQGGGRPAVLAAGDMAADAPGAHAALEHCPFCALSAGDPPLAPPDAAGLGPVSASSAAPIDPGGGPPARNAWHWARARAPPGRV